MSAIEKLEALKLQCHEAGDGGGGELCSARIRTLRFGDPSGEVRLLLDLCEGKYPGLWNSKEWRVSHVSDGEEFIPYDPEKRDDMVAWLTGAGDAHVQVEHESGCKTLIFWLVYGNEPGYLIADGSYHVDHEADWNAIADAHNALTEI